MEAVYPVGRSPAQKDRSLRETAHDDGCSREHAPGASGPHPSLVSGTGRHVNKHKINGVGSPGTVLGAKRGRPRMSPAADPVNCSPLQRRKLVDIVPDGVPAAPEPAPDGGTTPPPVVPRLDPQAVQQLLELLQRQ